MGTEAEATPMVLVPVVTVVEEVEGRLVMSTFTFREREEGPALREEEGPPALREAPLLKELAPLVEKSSMGKLTVVIWFLSSEFACISISLRNSRSL